MPREAKRGTLRMARLKSTCTIVQPENEIRDAESSSQGCTPTIFDVVQPPVPTERSAGR
eukprot:m.51383 g.51383  ORF g.51383 m.51383 type:complete len:59 (+) comp16426_c0_seq3:2088-2264(+)